MGNTSSTTTRSTTTTAAAESPSSKTSQDRCETCNEKYITKNYKWCRTCQINYLKKRKLVNWISGNKKIDDLIKKMQLIPGDTIVEWIPYNQFIDVKEIDKNVPTILYSAIWENGPLNYDYENRKNWERESNKNVILKYLYDSQNISDEFLNVRFSFS
jgi:hypothetical protein